MSFFTGDHLRVYATTQRSAASGARASMQTAEPRRAARRLQRGVGRPLNKGPSPRVGHGVGPGTAENLDEGLEPILPAKCSFALGNANQLYEFDTARFQLKTPL